MTTKEYIDITAAVTREKGSDFVLEQAKIRGQKQMKYWSKSLPQACAIPIWLCVTKIIQYRYHWY